MIVPFQTQTERMRDLRARLSDALRDRISYDEALRRFEGESVMLVHAYPHAAAWDAGTLSLDALEARWPHAALAGVSVRPVPDLVVRA